jgi:hypothetical protein
MKILASTIVLICSFILNTYGQLKQANAPSKKSKILSALPQQIVELSESITDIYQDDFGLSHTSADGNLRMGTYVNNSGAWLQTHTNHALTFSTNSASPQLRLFTNGNLSIGPQFPSAHLTVNGFSKLGYDAPSIEMKRFEGTTSASQGGVSVINHGIVGDDIISVNLVVDLANASNSHVPQNFGLLNLEVSTSFDATNIYVQNAPSTSSNALNKPFKVTVIYRRSDS